MERTQAVMMIRPASSGEERGRRKEQAMKLTMAPPSYVPGRSLSFNEVLREALFHEPVMLLLPSDRYKLLPAGFVLSMRINTVYDLAENGRIFQAISEKRTSIAGERELLAYPPSPGTYT